MLALSFASLGYAAPHDDTPALVLFVHARMRKCQVAEDGGASNSSSLSIAQSRKLRVSRLEAASDANNMYLYCGRGRPRSGWRGARRGRWDEKKL